MTPYKICDAQADDIPFLVQLTGVDLATWSAWCRKHVVVVARNNHGLLGVIVLRPVEEGTIEILHLEVMPYYRRLRLARMLWNHVIENTVPANFVANVPERSTDLQCTLRQFGFKCIGTRDGGALQFVRES